MKKLVSIFLALALYACACAHAARTSAFGLDVFNVVAPVTNLTNLAFSPMSFELDACLFAEACDSIGRANVAEAMGVLTEFDSVYGPILKRYAEVAATNGVSFLAARAFCLPSIAMASSDYRRRIFSLCGAEVCRDFPVKGAECWFRAKMMGEMEGFTLPVVQSSADRYYFFDLVSVKAAWRGASTGSARREFTLPDGTKKTLDFFTSRRTIRFRRGLDYTLYRLPLADETDLYVFLPEPGKSLVDVRVSLWGEKLREVLLSVDEMGTDKAGPARASIVFPKLDFVSETDLSPALLFSKVPQGAFRSMKATLVRRDSMELMRLRIVDDERIPVDDPEYTSNDLGEVAFDRPFIYMIHRKADDTMIALGQFTAQAQ